MSGSTLSRRVSEFVGVALFALALIWLVALASYAPSDPAWFFNTGPDLRPANFAGRVGAFLAELAFQLFGYASYLLPAVLVVVGWHYFWCQVIDAAYTKLVGTALLLACSASFLSLVFGTMEASSRQFRAGGLTGDSIARILSDYFNRTGSIILSLTVLFVVLVFVTQVSLGRLFSSAFEAVSGFLRQFLADWRERRADRRRDRQRREIVKKHLEKDPESPSKAALARAVAEAAPRRPEASRRNTPPPARPAPGARPSARTPAIAKHLSADETSLPLSSPEPVAKAPAERRNAGFALPPLALLDAPRSERKVDERELMESARLLEEKCREFSVEGSVIQIHPGPIVTTYEFKPEAGVKYSKVTGLADDLCLAMQAESIIIERLAGKSTVGIQIPNHVREQISLRELLESDVYRRSSSKLTLAMGKTIHGEPFVTDLASMPHLLIAGSTGSGKSVCVNAMLTSILYRATPDDVRLIMIDPKRLELGMYEEIPHLLTPVVVEPKQAANALRWAVKEMEERYKVLAAEGVRNIEQYNRNVKAAIEGAAKGTAPGEGQPRPLPFIIVLIDELADLMMVAGNEVEESIARLAQMARAVGIHLILATQRPSVDVITGLIKANLPARISFRVSSKIDSRTILDGNGAEQLLGRGDMLYLPPASSRLIRLHGPYISEQETARLASFLRKQGKPVYDETITVDDKQAEAIEFDKDDLYDEAARIVVSTGQASISFLQRRLRVGFSRAARLVDMMEAEGLVSAAVGGKPREVLVKKDYFEEVDVQLR